MNPRILGYILARLNRLERMVLKHYQDRDCQSEADQIEAELIGEGTSDLSETEAGAFELLAEKLVAQKQRAEEYRFKIEAAQMSSVFGALSWQVGSDADLCDDDREELFRRIVKQREFLRSHGR